MPLYTRDSVGEPIPYEQPHQRSSKQDSSKDEQYGRSAAPSNSISRNTLERRRQTHQSEQRHQGYSFYPAPNQTDPYSHATRRHTQQQPDNMQSDGYRHPPRTSRRGSYSHTPELDSPRQVADETSVASSDSISTATLESRTQTHQSEQYHQDDSFFTAPYHTEPYPQTTRSRYTQQSYNIQGASDQYQYSSQGEPYSGVKRQEKDFQWKDEISVAPSDSISEAHLKALRQAIRRQAQQQPSNPQGDRHPQKQKEDPIYVTRFDRAKIEPWLGSLPSSKQKKGYLHPEETSVSPRGSGKRVTRAHTSKRHRPKHSDKRQKHDSALSYPAEPLDTNPPSYPTAEDLLNQGSSERFRKDTKSKKEKSPQAKECTSNDHHEASSKGRHGHSSRSNQHNSNRHINRDKEPFIEGGPSYGYPPHAEHWRNHTQNPNKPPEPINPFKNPASFFETHKVLPIGKDGWPDQEVVQTDSTTGLAINWIWNNNEKRFVHSAGSEDLEPAHDPNNPIKEKYLWRQKETAIFYLAEDKGEQRKGWHRLYYITPTVWQFVPYYRTTQSSQKISIFNGDTGKHVPWLYNLENGTYSCDSNNPSDLRGDPNHPHHMMEVWVQDRFPYQWLPERGGWIEHITDPSVSHDILYPVEVSIRLRL